MIWIRIDVYSLIQRSMRQHPSNPALPLLISSISQERSACQRLCPNNEKNMWKKMIKKKKNSNTSPSLLINPASWIDYLFMELWGVVWIMWGMAKEGGAVPKTTKWQPHQNHLRAHANTSHQCHPSTLCPRGSLSAGGHTHTLTLNA